jgi:NAD(P)-dependent dehydrogenase (short-subunit alcohol dehydrogenase family)
MSSFKSLCSANLSAAAALKGTPVAVFVGGTSGIGQGMAEAFGRYTNGKAHIVIVGRNKEAADSILSRIPKPTSAEWSHEFVQCDISRMKNVQKASEEILAKHPKINFLVQSAGIMTTSGRDETEEGIDRKMAIHYYGRWKFIDSLLPALKKAKEDGEEAKSMSVFSAGHGGEINTDDLGLKKTYTLQNAASQTSTYNDLMNEVCIHFSPNLHFTLLTTLKEFAARNPGLTFLHAYPGGVRTALFDSSPSASVRIGGKAALFLLGPFMVTQDQCAEYMWGSIFNHTGGAFRVDNHGKDYGKKNYFGNAEQRRKLWEHTVKMTSFQL